MTVDYTKFNSGQSAASGARAAGVNQGLRSYMLQVYNYMTGAIALSGGLAYAVANSSFGMTLQTSGLMWLFIIGMIAIPLVLGFGINRLSTGAAQALFWVYAAAVGVSLSSVLLVYTGVSVAKVFFITSATFGAMSIYGYTTKKDLSGMGTMLLMGLLGIIIASIVNIFLKSTGLEFAISLIGVVIFVGLTAYDTQKIKETYYTVGGNEAVAKKMAIYGALNLYMDFVNLFLHLLRFIGDRR